MVSEREHRRHQLRREQENIIEQAAVWLRRQGHRLADADRDRMYSVAELYDGLASHLGELPQSLRDRAVTSAWKVSGEQLRRSSEAGKTIPAPGVKRYR